MKTRRGTAITKCRRSKYLLPRIFEHNGRWATLEDWFDLQRMRDDYVPTGFKSYSAKRDVLKGHPFESFERRHFSKASIVPGFTTIRIENIPAGWRAKESFRVLSPDEFVETFSLAAPWKDFAVYSETHLKRVKW